MAIVLLIFHVMGAISSIHAIMATRTAQGAIAWAVSLNTFPYLAVPAYWVFGRNKFQGYVSARQLVEEEVLQVSTETLDHFERVAVPHDRLTPGLKVVDSLTDLPISQGNDVELLVDGDATFSSIFAGIESATDYILFQFYIVKSDGLGQRVKDLLVAKARAGVRVYFLYDEVGSSLTRTYRRELEDAGVRISPFNTTQGARNRFQLNFRNHRKIVVIDGKEAWIGGHNVGDEYLGLDPRFGHWRDTHVRLIGPAVMGAQLSFFEDWYWATRQQPELDWNPEPSSSHDRMALVVPTGPADPRETASILFLQAIATATERVWIASPYFVPDEAVLKALELAALKGVDVRVLIPDRPDHLLVYLAAYAYLDLLDSSDVAFYRYTDGFLHQTVMLVDGRIAVVGTHNLDNRSLRLNFEVSVLAVDESFAAEIAAMLEEDFANARKMHPGEFKEKPYWLRFAARVARLASPIL